MITQPHTVCYCHILIVPKTPVLIKIRAGEWDWMKSPAKIDTIDGQNSFYTLKVAVLATKTTNVSNKFVENSCPLGPEQFPMDTTPAFFAGNKMRPIIFDAQ